MAGTLAEERDEVTSWGVITTQLNPVGWADSMNRAHDYLAEEFIKSPIIRKGEAIQIEPRLMEVSTPYPFRFLEWWFLAVKSRDGSLNFFQIELPEEK